MKIKFQNQWRSYKSFHDLDILKIMWLGAQSPSLWLAVLGFEVIITLERK